MDFTTKTAVRAMCWLEVRRADGRVEKLGLQSYWHRNPIYRGLYRIYKSIPKGRLTTFQAIILKIITEK